MDEPSKNPSKNLLLSGSVSCSAIAIPLLLMLGTLLFFAWMQRTIEQRSRVFPLDSYFYHSMADNIQKGNGPCVDWPQGPRNKYLPGFAYWWSLFLPRGLHPDDSIRRYGTAQCATLLLFIAALVLLGRAVWKDWPTALGFAALTSAAPIPLKWGILPMGELLAGACVTACAAAAFFLLDDAPDSAALPEKPRPLSENLPAGRKKLLLAALALFGTIGVFTRLETAYALGLLVFYLVRRKRLPWTLGAVILILAVLPVAVWQVWVTARFHEGNIYVAEGVKSYNPAAWHYLLFFQFMHFIRVPDVGGSRPIVNFLMIPVSLGFMAAILVALRGYLGRAATFSAWLLAGYWLLHSFWYYQSERYNIIVVAFGFLFLMEGAGRLYHLREGWRGPGGRVALAIVCLIYVPVFWGHAWDNAVRMVAYSNSFHPAMPRNQQAILDALEREPPPPRTERVFLTDLSLPDSRRLPGVVWREKPDYLIAPYEPGRAQEFMRETGITHLALRQPIRKWMQVNGKGLECEMVFEDDMVWIARVKKQGSAPRQGDSEVPR